MKHDDLKEVLKPEFFLEGDALRGRLKRFLNTELKLLKEEGKEANILSLFHNDKKGKHFLV